MSSNDVYEQNIDVAAEKRDDQRIEPDETMAAVSQEDSTCQSEDTQPVTAATCSAVTKEETAPVSAGDQDYRTWTPKSLLAEKLRFCGVTKSIENWVAIAGIRPSTVCSRIRRGMSPENALTTPDREGHFLRVLTDAEIQAAIKSERQHRSFTSISWHAEEEVHGARIVAHHRVLNLGDYDSSDEANYAFNTAIDLLPEEWEESDKTPISQPLSTERALEIETNVRSLMQEHGETDPELTLFDFPQDDPYWGVVWG